MKILSALLAVAFAAANVQADAVRPLKLAMTPTSKIGVERSWAPPDYWQDRLTRKRAEIAASGGAFDIVFLGDSITHNWEGWPEEQWRTIIARPGMERMLPAGNSPGRRELERLSKTYRILNLGVGGDTTGDVLWRVRYGGQLDGYRTKCVVLMIGTNNREKDPADVAAGIRAILDEIAQHQPEAVTLLLPIFPRGARPDDPKRIRNEAVNALICGFADGRRIVWVDFNDKFLTADGELTREMMPDLLHPSEKGYEIWGRELEPYFARLCRPSPREGLARAFQTTVERPVSITTNAQGSVLVDFGRDAYGWLEFVSPVAGAYKLDIGEIVRDGSVWMAPLGSNIRSFRLQGRTTPGVFRIPVPIDARNTSEGALLLPPELGVVLPFRAVELDHGPFWAATFENVRRVTVRYGYDLSESSFRCSDPRLEKVWDFLKHTVAASTAFGLFVDGDRERLPYEGDSLATQLASYAAFSDTEIARATFEHLMDHPTWPTEGKFCMVMMAWHDWQRTGKTDFAAKWYDRLVAEKMNAEKCRADGLLVTDVKRDNPDWPRCERDGYDLRPVNAEVNAYYCHALALMSDLASSLGKTADAEAFAAKAVKTRAAFNATFTDPSTGLYLDGEGSRHSSLHANALPLAFGLVPESRRERVADFVASRARRCSPYFMLYVLEGLSKSGREKDVFDALLADDDRSWLGMLDFGATMGMEAWNLKVKPNLDVNHSWVAVPLHFIVRWVLGVNPTGPGWRDFTVTPHLGPLTWAEGDVPTPAGVVHVRAERQVDGTVRTEVRKASEKSADRRFTHTKQSSNKQERSRLT